jgi:hypothetical protein
MPPPATLVALVIRLPQRHGHGIKRLGRQLGSGGVSDIARKAIQLRCASELGRHPSVASSWADLDTREGDNSPDIRSGRVSMQLKCYVAPETAEMARATARQTGLSLGSILVQGVNILLLAHGRSWPQRGCVQARRGRPSSIPWLEEDDIPLVILDDETEQNVHDAAQESVAPAA